MLVIAHYSYLANLDPLARDTERLILEFNPAWTMAGSTGMYPQYVDDVIRAGLEFVETFGYDHREAFSHARWRGRMRTCNGVGSGGLSPAEVVRFDAALADLLAASYPDPVQVTHRVWAVVARTPE